jgi:hypothetical protein
MVEGSCDLSRKPAFGVVHGFAVLDFMADGDAPSAEDALVVIALIKGVGRSQGVVVLFSQETRFPDAELISVFLQKAGAAFFAGHAIVGMIGQ